MKYYWLIILLLLTSCGGNFILTPAGHRFLYKSRDQQLSCYSGQYSDGSNCCWPYKDKLMICTFAAFNDIGDESGSIVIRFVPEN
jgi:hypothetical protein